MNIHGLKKQRQKVSKLKTKLMHKSRNDFRVGQLNSKIKRLNLKKEKTLEGEEKMKNMLRETGW